MRLKNNQERNLVCREGPWLRQPVAASWPGKMKPAGAQQHQIIEVSASARPSEVVAAVIAGAQQPRSPALNHNRWIQMTVSFT